MTALPTAEQLEDVFFAALKEQDFDGVMAALMVMVDVDAPRAKRLHDALQDAVSLAKMLDTLASETATPDSSAQVTSVGSRDGSDG